MPHSHRPNVQLSYCLGVFDAEKAKFPKTKKKVLKFCSEVWEK